MKKDLATTLKLAGILIALFLAYLFRGALYSLRRLMPIMRLIQNAPMPVWQEYWAMKHPILLIVMPMTA